MSNIEELGIAYVSKRLLKEILKSEPDLIQDNGRYVVQYSPDKLKIAQSEFARIMSKKGSVDYRILDITYPYLIKKYGLYVALSLIALIVLVKLI